MLGSCLPLDEINNQHCLLSSFCLEWSTQVTRGGLKRVSAFRQRGREADAHVTQAPGVLRLLSTKGTPRGDREGNSLHSANVLHVGERLKKGLSVQCRFLA